MPFGLKNAGAMRAMTALFHDMMHEEMEVYVDDMIVMGLRIPFVNFQRVFDILRK
jgi:hypothetical protein